MSRWGGQLQPGHCPGHVTNNLSNSEHAQPRSIMRNRQDLTLPFLLSCTWHDMTLYLLATTHHCHRKPSVAAFLLILHQIYFPVANPTVPQVVRYFEGLMTHQNISLQAQCTAVGDNIRFCVNLPISPYSIKTQQYTLIGVKNGLLRISNVILSLLKTEVISY